MKRIIEDFKQTMHDGMLNNYKKDGYLEPILFFIRNGQPYVTIIPKEFLSSSEGKEELSGMIKSLCQDPLVFAAGLIIEAYGRKVNTDEEEELSKLLMDGSMRVSELKEKTDIIIMIYSTPEKEETISYIVDPKTKTIGEKFADTTETSGVGGIFSGFFKARKN